MAVLAPLVKEGRHIGGKRRVELHELASPGMDETESLGVEGLTRTDFEAIADKLPILRIDSALADLVSPVTRIVEERMAYPVHVDPYLMGSSSLQTALHKGHEAEALQHLVMGHGMLSLVTLRENHEAHPVIRVAAYITIYGTLIVGNIAPDYRLVTALDRMNEELTGEIELGLVILGDYEQTAGIHVYSVDQYAHPLVFGIGPLGYPQMIGKRVDESSVKMAVAWMYAHAGRLVDYQHVLILIDYVERNVFRLDLEAMALVRQHELNLVVRSDYGISLGRLPVEKDVASLYRKLNPVARSVLKVVRHEFIDPYRSLAYVGIEPEMLEHSLLFILLQIFLRRQTFFENLFVHVYFDILSLERVRLTLDPIRTGSEDAEGDCLVTTASRLSE